MATGAIALPEGFTLDAPSGGGLPQGFTLDQPQAKASAYPKVIDNNPFIGQAEATAALASGAIAAPLGGILGAARTLFPGRPGAGADLSQSVSEALTYSPRTAAGQAITGAVAAPFELLAKGADAAGQATTDATGSPALGTAVNTGIQALPMAVGKVVPKAAGAMLPDTKPAVKTAMDAGFKATPEEAGAGGLQKGVASLAGEPRLARKNTQKNQPLINEKIAADFEPSGVKKGTPITRELLDEVIEKNGQAYDTIRKSGKVDVDRQFLQDLGDAVRDLRTAGKDFNHGSNPAMQMYQRLTRNDDGSLKRSFDANSAVSEIKTLRAEAKKAYRNGDNQLGAANIEAAKALENILDRHMGKQGGDMTAFKQARQQIAKAYDAERALVADGEINPQAYAKALAKGAPLSGGALEVAEAARALPRSMQKPSPQATGATASDIGMMFLKGAGTGGVSMSDLLLIGARPAARSVISSAPYQSAFLRGGGLTGALASDAAGQALPLGAGAGLAAALPRPAPFEPGDMEFSAPQRGMPPRRVGGGTR